MNETERTILQLAETSKNPEEFTLKLERLDIPLREKGSSFFAVGILLYKYSLFEFALASWKKALTYFLKTKDREGESDCYGNLGNLNLNLSNFRESIDYFEKALEIEKELENRPGEAKSYTGLGLAYYSSCDFRRAIEYFEMELKIEKELKNKPGEANSYTGLGVAYCGLGDFKRAIEYYEMELKIEKELKNKPGEAICYTNLGNAYVKLEDFRRAIKYYDRTLKMEKKLRNRSRESSCYTGLGNVYYGLGDFRRAIKSHKLALEIRRKIGDRSGESHCYTNLGIAYRDLGDFKRAEENYERALEMAKELCNIELERVVDLNLAALYSESNFVLAYKYCRCSIQLTEIISEKLVQEDYTRDFQAHASRAYQLMVPLCLKLGKQTEAFEFVEASKSRAFLELLAATKIKPTVESTNELITLLKDEETLLGRWREIQTRHLKQTNTQIEPGEAEKILQKLNTIYYKIGKFDSEYVSARRAKPLSLDNTVETLTLLNKPIILVEYFVTEKETFIFTVSSRNRKLHTITVPLSERKLRECVEDFEKDVMNYDPRVGDIGESWLKLGDYLIKPIQNLLTGNDLICFVPYGLLHSLPLHALKLEGKRLIETHPVVYSPSASLIRFSQNKGSGKLQTCISFGVALKNQIRLEEIVEDTSNGVANLFGTKAYNSEAATKERALKEIEDKDVVHFSCHGYLNQKDPLSSGVVLYNEEILSAREIFDLRLNAEIVTLGACQTGVSERSLGDELVGLTRAFLYAGAPSLIVSLWSVNATSTKELILEFYKLAKSGVDKATALQQAQKKIMAQEKYSHPYYWAPFILIGKS